MGKHLSTERVDIYNLPKDFVYWQKRIAAEPKITPRNKVDMALFFEGIRADPKIKNKFVRLLIYVPRLFQLAKMLGADFRTATKDDLKKLVSKIQANKQWSENTKRIFYVALKKFYKIIEGENEHYPEKINWLKFPSTEKSTLEPGEIITSEECQSMITAARKPRDKAFIAFLFDSGTRITEAANIRLKDLRFEKENTSVFIREGKSPARWAPLLPCVQHLNVWLECHPRKDDENAFLFCKSDGSFLPYHALCRIIAEAAHAAGVKKKFSPHKWRHASATFLKKASLDDYAMTKRFGWSANSRMIGIYANISQEDVANQFLAAHGKASATQNKPAQISCPRCKIGNDPGSRFCVACGQPLALKVFVEQQDTEAENEQRMAKLETDLEETRALLKQLVVKRS